MQYRATMRNIVLHSPIEDFLAALERPHKAPIHWHRSRTRTSSSRSNEWNQINAAATAPNDFWARTVGWPKQETSPPLDR